MLIGVPSEIKNQEHRVGLIPSGAHRLTEAGHDVMIQAGAGLGAGIPDEHFVAVGARIVETADQAWDAEMVIKVKEPVKPEWHRMREGQTLFTYLHLAADVPLTHELMNQMQRTTQSKIKRQTISRAIGKTLQVFLFEATILAISSRAM